MKKSHLQLLGVRVLPLVKRSQYGAANWDRVGNLNYLQGEERQKYASRVVDEATKEQRQENREQEWEVFSIHSDGTFTLRSDFGYERVNVSRNGFRIIKTKFKAK